MHVYVSPDKQELVSKARTYTPKDVGDFLISIKLEEYVQAFIEADVGGDVLLDADCEFLNALEVNSLLDCVRIMTLFTRRLQNTEPRLPVSEVLRFLRENKFEKYVELFKQNEIDGDMLVDTDPGLIKNMLKDIGIVVVDRVSILNKFKTFASSEQ